MRIAKVIGKVTLNESLAEVPAGSFLIVRTFNRGTLAGDNAGNEETLICYDNLSAREGDVIGLVEGREASAPFYPDKVPFNSYNACILDDLNFQPVLEADK